MNPKFRAINSYLIKLDIQYRDALLDLFLECHNSSAFMSCDLCDLEPNFNCHICNDLDDRIQWSEYEDEHFTNQSLYYVRCKSLYLIKRLRQHVLKSL